MKRNKSFVPTSLLGVLVVLYLAGAVLPVMGQEDEKIEELKNQMKELQKKIKQVEQRQKLKEDRIEFLEDEVEEQDKEAASGGELFPEQEWQPGWERAKNDMQPGKLEEMNLHIGRTGDMDFYLGVDTVGRMQDFDQEHAFNGFSQLDGPSLDFQKADGNIEFLASFNDDRENKDPYLEIYFDWLISSRHHSEMFGDQGYMLLRRIPEGPTFLNGLFNFIDLKAGEYELPFGDQIYRRSNNAAVQRNPLIGNSVVDHRATETGVTVMNDSPSSEVGKINWLFNVSSGDPSPSFDQGNSFALLPKVWTNLTENLRVSGSLYKVDQADNGPGFPFGGDSSNLLTGLRDTGGIYHAVLGGGADSGQVLFQGGQDVLALQGDVTYRTDTVELYGHIGRYEDDDINGSVGGSPSEEWTYTTLEGVYRFTDRLYAAARYSAAFGDEIETRAGGSSVSTDGIVHRFQLGGGYWLTESILFKTEYVHQEYEDFDSGERRVSGVDQWADPFFHGVVAEFSFAF